MDAICGVALNSRVRVRLAVERQQKTRLATGVYIAKTERRTFAQVAELFLKERTARNRRTSSIACYKTVLTC